MTVGQYLVELVGLRATDPENVSAEAVRDEVLKPFNINLSVNPKTFQNSIWPDFRCVAHFWAAFLWRLLDKHKPGVPYAIHPGFL